MTIYIDPPLWPAHGTLFSHLISDDSLEELHAFASRAGLSGRAFDRDHYDVPAHRRSGLVSLGAVPVSARELARILAGCGLRVRGVERAEKVRGRLELAWGRLGTRLGLRTGGPGHAGGAGIGTPAGRPVHTDAQEGGPSAWLEAPSSPEAAGWQALGGELLGRWSEPHRHYHSMTHLASVLSAAAALHRAGEPTASDDVPLPTASGAVPGSGTGSGSGHTLRHHSDLRSGTGPAAPVVLAAWFHDAVYAGEAGSDEEASAALAEEGLEPLLPEPVVAETARLVRLTAGHSPGERDHGGAVLTDADLEVLARPPAAYRRYVQQVRADYSHVPDEDFAAGRAAVLERLLGREQLYRTRTGRRRWEAPARRNLEAEIQSLRSGRAGEDFGLG